eukprot:scaffold6168_cov420-Prasinococcus_capsulatus_cf.AAC.4
MRRTEGRYVARTTTMCNAFPRCAQPPQRMRAGIWACVLDPPASTDTGGRVIVVRPSAAHG